MDEIFVENEKNSFQFITSTITLHEVLVLPYKLKKYNIAQKYENILLNSDTIEIVEMNIKISISSAKIRADYNFKTPDSIQIATALDKKCQIFLTNDKDLLRFKDIEIIIIDNLISLL